MIPSLPRPAWLRAVTAAYVVAFLVFLFLPLIVVAVFAFNDAPYPAPPWHGFTLDWFLGNASMSRVGLFGDAELLGSIATSAVVALWVTVLSVAVGTCNAFLLERGRFPGKQLLSVLMLAPLVIPGVILGISILAFASRIAQFAGDVMGTGFHAVDASGLRPGDVAAVLGLGPVGLCAVQAARAAGAAHVFAIDSVPERLAVAESYGAQPLHLGEQDVRALVRSATDGRGVDVSIDAVGDPKVLESAIRLTRSCGAIQCIGVYAERAEVHMGLLWLKALTLRGGHANVLGHVDRVLAMMAAGVLDPSALVTHHMKLEQAPEAYAVYDRREALKIVLTP